MSHGVTEEVRVDLHCDSSESAPPRPGPLPRPEWRLPSSESARDRAQTLAPAAARSMQLGDVEGPGAEHWHIMKVFGQALHQGRLRVDFKISDSDRPGSGRYSNSMSLNLSPVAMTRIK